MQKWIPVVLCGGSGTRLWPLSREHFPKQFVTLQSERSLFQETLQRLEGLNGVQAPLIVTHEEHRFLVSDQLRQMNQTPAVILLEPQARNTAPALTLAALWVQAHQPDALMLVMPSDHAMQDPAAFRSRLTQAAELAQEDRIVTFGIVPERPETGYGYIHADGEQILGFVEKPDEATARQYLEQGTYLWNSGMFVLSAQTWIEQIERYAPEILRSCQTAFAQGKTDADFFRPESTSFAACPARSIDYAVMEKTRRGAVLGLKAGWSDVGSWDALKALYPTDAHGNACQGDVISLESSGNLLQSSGRLVAAVGVENLLVIETPDAVLVASQDHAQDVRELVGKLREANRPEAQNHRRVARPWGAYETVDQGERFQVKRITVHPGQALSKQMHHHRAEHWIVVKGTAQVTRGDETFLLTENQSTYIPLGSVHRLENPGTIDLELIEVQSGPYLGEDDIVRFEDRYQRN
ncbi:mannose-1-phosphate guanylyltransferase/mannose-6-phosphate isomerase [bacterium (Candidatus Blackallbacteria) CG17_big_fil_post_rev_8_21_14_2_50_48_46]|uniref:mannose-1-phosphate guanylyltransferase n=1 Tax=bacterium (Candidatus Blackallbacteria) CG17_big_fil_post_rev_8_21_14_2_50_48_46 TaxID=2014261 RepID=A0A2M7G4W2_9BACT|nr:MAG: mannose-1-phosphate guanylyltransferase/mannose-6-phosphate isomerase [bacterium (Candidatus Blackallbacteria) CG18_big_fil_WC_8_21_14_2_50_49_26]PIW16947.1 MAG: mannose-1-phosphate guanylyltransferase/mannose-6-phosphate isomerase [bacterium (Candidatus Blackallbacteria) CG17_big_fil_post_rev_8_21_14_2_50_48_46]PIW50225.1 MAG: mannose-1-phosphate guanylyltransferase/mannose-6-phosphate isomerase [bacterium (Candidatus Blackallbacteria) CG13_big_fil_rev_8_21_14_2_50_49_14]